jgi:hypothetical protein
VGPGRALTGERALHLAPGEIGDHLGPTPRCGLGRTHRGLTLFACPGGESHDLGLLGIALLLRRRRIDVCMLGANVPASALAEVVRTIRPPSTCQPHFGHRCPPWPSRGGRPSERGYRQRASSAVLHWPSAARLGAFPASCGQHRWMTPPARSASGLLLLPAMQTSPDSSPTTHTGPGRTLYHAAAVDSPVLVGPAPRASPSRDDSQKNDSA